MTDPVSLNGWPAFKVLKIHAKPASERHASEMRYAAKRVAVCVSRTRRVG